MSEPRESLVKPALHGALIVQAIGQAGVSHILSVPDIHTSEGLLTPLAADPAFTLIRVCKEDECLGIAAGLSYGHKRALILIQYTGMLYAMNAIRAIACEQHMPICMMIGLLGHRGGPPAASKRLGVRVVEPLLDVMGIAHHLIDSDDDIEVIPREIARAYEGSRPIALLLSRPPAPT